MENTSAKLTPKANPKAISIRLGSRTYGQVTGSRNHDLRLGRIPNYVDQERSCLNDTLIKPFTAPELRDICEKRRANRQVGKARRGLRSDAAVMRDGIITFGTEAQKVFEALDRQTQNEALTAVAEGIATRLKTTLAGLVVHRDETSIHAHFDLPAVNDEGHPISQANSQSDIGRLQDLAAEIIARFEPAIERGHKKRDRLAAGASFSETIHRSVKELHRDLPLELEKKRKRVAEMETRVAELEAKAELSLAENKRLEVYKKRHQDRIAELTQVESEMRAAADALMEDEKAKIRAEAQTAADAIRKEGHDSVDAALDGFSLVLEGKIEPTMKDDRRSWRAKEKLDENARKRFQLSLRMFAPLFDRFHEIIATLQSRIERLGNLVKDLEIMHAEMNEQQRQKLDEAKSELDDPSPF